MHSLVSFIIEGRIFPERIIAQSIAVPGEVFQAGPVSLQSPHP